MSEESSTQPEQNIITLEGEDGESYRCRILDLFELEKQEYCLLEKIAGAEGKDDEGGSLVIMRLITRDGASIFRTIESDEEFNRVTKYVEEQSRPGNSG
jgi:uncharacterized protein YrzB (UPF0473 family)